MSIVNNGIPSGASAQERKGEHSHLPAPKPTESTEKNRKHRIRTNIKINRKGDSLSWSFESHLPGLQQPELADVFATADHDFHDGIIRSLLSASGQEGISQEYDVNFMLSVIKSIDARDPIEVMLGAHMAAINSWIMRLAGSRKEVTSYEQLGLLVKLARTFPTLMDALDRHRRNGEQKVTVQHQHQHVSVSEGGQAIVGNITHAPASASKESPGNGRRPPLAIAAGKDELMPIISERRVGAAVAVLNRDK